MQNIKHEQNQTHQDNLTQIIPLTVEHIKQHVYCPRITFWRNVFKHKVKPTYKMTYSKKYHEKRQARARISKETQEINIYIHDKELNLTGILDITQLSNDQVMPIEIKFTSQNKIPAHHYMQLLAQAYLLETYLKKEIPKGAIKKVGREKITLPFPKHKKIIIKKILTEIREIIYHEILPDPTPNTNKCKECEHYVICKRA